MNDGMVKKLIVFRKQEHLGKYRALTTKVNPMRLTFRIPPCNVVRKGCWVSNICNDWNS